ncbi:hypothetical protein AMK59_198 [Oryctes borbonicus]|uniref:Uncharacterized protein n=1 Tax=Oryctes borbonicus TaxID=1629725 RepID=A0A0T6BFF5_9SCAR|nr:hypothetical protein AMK59_198 [Oryctes borbonicus]
MPLSHVISTKFDLCGPMNEISLDFLDESSVTIELVSDEYTRNCKMKIIAPDTHVIYLNVIENIPSDIQRDILRVSRTGTCQLKVVSTYLELHLFVLQDKDACIYFQYFYNVWKLINSYYRLRKLMQLL